MLRSEGMSNKTNIIKHAVILCAGSAARAGLGFNKVFYPLGQKNVLETVLEKFAGFDRVVIVAAAQDIPQIKEILRTKTDINCIVTEGGKTRSDSVRNGLKAAEGCGVAVIHDAARPFVSADLIERTVDSAVKYGSGIAAVRVVDSIKETQTASTEIKIAKTLDRSALFAAQTPQSFRYTEIVDAYTRIDGSFEDDSEVYRLAGYTPMIVEGEYGNKKLTSPADFLPLNGGLIGTGFDVHRLVEGRKLIVGGVHIPFDKGLLGHSDADVLLHALMDALLSAAGLCDIGVLFPDTDDKYKGADSIVLLKDVAARLKDKKIETQYVSAVIIAQKPKMAPHILDMRQNIARALGINVEGINISATTTEFMGIVGGGEAIAASVVCICKKE